MELNLAVLVVHKLNISERILDMVKTGIYNSMPRNSLKPAGLYYIFILLRFL